MNMKILRILLMCAAPIPFLLKVPYLLHAWKGSPLDRFDFIFYLLALLITAVSFRSLKKQVRDFDMRALWFLIPAFCFWGLMLWRHIHTLQIAGALLFLLSMSGLLFGLRIFVTLTPVLGICLLGCPSTTYWTEYFCRELITRFSLSGFLLKAFAAGLLAVSFFLLKKYAIRLQTLLFLCALFCVCMILAIRHSPPAYGNALIVDSQKMRVGDYLAFVQAVTPQEERFFRGNQATRHLYISGTRKITLLSIRITGDIHSIHPTELCLKSARNTIHDHREIVFMTARGGLACQEMTVTLADNRSYLVYAWYAGPDWSTGNFLSFRRHWTSRAPWYTFQLMTDIGGDRKKAEACLRDFLDAALIPPAR